MECEVSSAATLVGSPVQIEIDSSCGLLEVRLESSDLEFDALHFSYFLDRATLARWGEAASEKLSKCQALAQLRGTVGWGDAPEDANEQERQTLDRLTLTPVWDSAICLANVLAVEAIRSHGYRPGKILELGAGLGLPGFLAARLWPHASVAVTETGASLTNLLQRNLRANFPVISGVKRLRSSRTLLTCDMAFGSESTEAALMGPLHKFRESTDLVIVSDCFFYPWYGDTWSPLRESLLQLCNETTLILLGTKRRDGGRVAEAVDYVSSPPFHKRLLLKLGGCCDVCRGEGFINSEVCWECEGVDVQSKDQEIWLLSKSETALQRWKSSTI